MTGMSWLMGRKSQNMSGDAKPGTVGELRCSGYEVVSVRDELRRNLIRKIEEDEELFPGIIGFEESVVPQLENVEEGREAKVVEELLRKAVANVFARYFKVEEMDEVVLSFEEGLAVEAGSDVPSSAYVEALSKLNGLPELIKRIQPSGDRGAVASAVEFILDGIHLNRRLNKAQVSGGYRYSG